eukprot:9497906-Pyramimonas_sp.AAC.1
MTTLPPISNGDTCRPTPSIPSAVHSLRHEAPATLSYSCVAARAGSINRSRLVSRRRPSVLPV